MKKKRTRDSIYLLLKLDMRKAYDQVEWEYLKAIMIRHGFHHLWVDMIMRLVTIVYFSVLFNGDWLYSFVPSRGIRQGDPISPYLSLLAVEGISCLLNSRIQSSNFSGIRVAASNFRYLEDRVWKRVQWWMEQALSASGKEVLIKAVAQAVLTFWTASGCREACGSILMGYSGASNGEARRVRGGHAG
jgi:hypothetical protein